MPKLDPNAAERTSGWEMQDGVYEVELKSVLDADPKTHKAYEGPNGPYWMWNVVFPKDANGGRFALREVSRVISLGQTSDGMRAEAYAAFGIDPSEDTDTGIGRRALAKVENEEYEGVTRPKIRAFYPLDAASRITTPDTGAAKTKPGASKVKEEAANF